MKSERDTKRSMLGARNRALKDCKELAAVLEAMQETQGPYTSGEMKFIRDTAEDITQRVHDFSAYHNVVFGGNND